MPKQKEIEIPLLEALIELGGEAKPSQIYHRVTGKFPDVTSRDLSERLPSGGNRWTNRIQWARLNLLHNGEIESPRWGIWKITEKGR